MLKGGRQPLVLVPVSLSQSSQRSLKPPLPQRFCYRGETVGRAVMDSGGHYPAAGAANLLVLARLPLAPQPNTIMAELFWKVLLPSDRRKDIKHKLVPDHRLQLIPGSYLN